MGWVGGSGICIATSASGVNSPVTVTPMPSRQRSVERPQTCASLPKRDAATPTSESNGKRGLRRCSGWRSLALEPNMAIAGRDYVPPITLRPFVYEWLQIAAGEMSFQPSRTTHEKSLRSNRSRWALGQTVEREFDSGDLSGD
jgi:hypothetical protein